MGGGAHRSSQQPTGLYCEKPHGGYSLAAFSPCAPPPRRPPLGGSGERVAGLGAAASGVALAIVGALWAGVGSRARRPHKGGLRPHPTPVSWMLGYSPSIQDVCGMRRWSRPGPRKGPTRALFWPLRPRPALGLIGPDLARGLGRAARRADSPARLSPPTYVSIISTCSTGPPPGVRGCAAPPAGGGRLRRPFLPPPAGCGAGLCHCLSSSIP